jgi:hypothetical protein
MITLSLLSAIIFIITLVVFMLGLIPLWVLLLGVSIAYGTLFVFNLIGLNQKYLYNPKSSLLTGKKKLVREELKKYLPKRWVNEKSSVVIDEFLVPLLKNSNSLTDQLILLQFQCDFTKSLVRETTKTIHQTFQELIEIIEKIRRENPSYISADNYSGLLKTLQHEDIINQMLQHVGQFLSFEEFETGSFAALYDIYRIKKNKHQKKLAAEFQQRVSKVLTINNEKIVLNEFLKGVAK